MARRRSRSRSRPMLERLEQLEKAATDCWTPVRDRASAEKSVNASQMILMAAPALLAVALGCGGLHRQAPATGRVPRHAQRVLRDVRSPRATQEGQRWVRIARHAGSPRRSRITRGVRSGTSAGSTRPPTVATGTPRYGIDNGAASRAHTRRLAKCRLMRTIGVGSGN